MIPTTPVQTTHCWVTSEPMDTPDNLKKDLGQSMPSASAKVRKPGHKRPMEPQTWGATNDIKKRKLLPVNERSYIAAAHPVGPQPSIHGRLDPQLKACLIRYVETSSRNEPVPVEDYKTLFNYFRYPLPNMDLSLLDTEDLEHLCEQGFSLGQIPAKRITRNLCLLACSRDSANLDHVPLVLKDSEVCKVACTQNPHKINKVPDNVLSAWRRSGFLEKLFSMDKYIIYRMSRADITYPMIVDGCKAGVLAYKFIAEDHPKRNELLKITFERNLLALKHFPAEMQTPDIFRLACERSGDAIQYVPEKDRDFDLCKIAVGNNPVALRYLNPRLTDQEREQIYWIACTHSAESLRYVPQSYLNYALFKQACLNPKIEYYFEYLPQHFSHIEKKALFYTAFTSTKGKIVLCKSDKTVIAMIEEFDDIYQLACHVWENAIKKDALAYFDIPPLFRTADHWNLALKSELCPDFFEAVNDLKSLSRLPYIPVSKQHSFLSNSKKSLDEKIRFIELVDGNGLQPGKPPSAKNLVTTTSPLHNEVRNPFLMDLITTAYNCAGFEPANLWLGKQIHSDVKNNATVFPITDIPEPLLAENYQYQEIVGGRTIQFIAQEKSENSIYFKFRRKGEPLQELAGEGLLYQYLDRHPEIKMQFKSQLPSLSGFMKIPLDEHLKTTLKTFPDPVEIIEENGQQFVHVFSYTAATEYAKYAYVADSDPGKPFNKSEQAILDACDDWSKMARMGLVLTGMLPAFHDTLSARRWVALFGVFNVNNKATHPGTFGAWNTDATCKPDVGHSGIRDIGDYELFGQIKSCLQQHDTQDSIHPWSVSQRLALANAMSEMILTAVLLRSRLRQPFAEYHYQNPEAVAETASFIECACNKLLAGFNASNASEEQTSTLLQATLRCSDAEYQQWLHRAAQEVVYWTALQPGEEQYEQLPQSRFDHAQCYLNHATGQRKLSPELYPEAEATQKKEVDFYNINGRLNLGVNNGTFPFISLMNGLTRMVTGVLMTGGGRTQ